MMNSEFTALTRQYPADSAGRINLATAFLYTRNFEAARQQGQQAVEINPKRARDRSNTALYAMYAQFHVVVTTVGLILADSVIALPYVVVIVGAAIKRVPPDLELVAMSLGASRARALIGITFRLTLPAIAAAFVLAFLAAFDEATFVNFVGGPDLVTLPKAIFDSLRLGVDPLITGIATILMGLTGITMMLAVWLRRT